VGMMPDTPFESVPCSFCLCGGIIRDGVCQLCGKEDDTPDFWNDAEKIHIG